MKRTLCVMLLLVLAVPVLLIPASAAEEYVFEHFPDDIMLYGTDFEMAADDGFFFIDGKIPAGSYSVVFTGLEADVCLSEPLIVSFDDFVCIDVSFFPGSSAEVSLLVGDVAYSGQVFCFYVESENLTVFAALADSDIFVLFDTAESARFTLIPPMAFVMDGFSSLLFWIDSVWQLIQDNALLASFAASGLVILCVPIFISLKKATH